MSLFCQFEEINRHQKYSDFYHIHRLRMRRLDSETKSDRLVGMVSAGKLVFFMVVYFSAIGAVANVSVTASQYPGLNQFEGIFSAGYLFEYKFNSNFKIKVEPFAQAISKDSAFFQFKELDLQIKNSGQIYKIGYSTTEWEGTDFINPMDFTNPKNFQDPLNPMKISQFNLGVSGQVGDFSFDFLYIPQQKTAVLPGNKSPWWPHEYAVPTLEKDTILLLPDEVEYQIDDPIFEKGARENNLAFRLQYLGENRDITLAFYEGMAVLPKLNPIISIIPIEVSPKTIYLLESPIEIQPSYYRHRVMAFAYVQTFKYLILRFSANHSQPIFEAKTSDLWRELGVLSLEKNFPKLTFLLQAVASKRSESTEVSLVSSLLDKSLMAGFRWPINDQLLWSVAAFQEQTNFSYYIKSDLKYNWSETINQVLTVDSLEGSKSSLLGAFSKNDRVSLKVTYLF